MTSAEELAVIFNDEHTCMTLQEFGLRNAWEKIPFDQRVTHPGKGKYPDATFDYIFASKECSAGVPKITESILSDHRPVTCEIGILGP
jgi:endonuclease/exonuclease/phosphatase family metal-dependent hydrolase